MNKEIISSVIVDDEYTEVDVDIQKVQMKPTMYISYVGDAGVEHLAHEITNNIIDEHENPNSVSDGTASIFYDAQENTISFSDTGRGIPFPKLEAACTILHAGSKMQRAYGNTAGENGVGLTVTNALSELFEITSTRDGASKFLQFKDGVKVIDQETTVKDPNKHGLLVSFRPSAMFLGKDSRLPVESFSQWLFEQSFMLPKDLEIVFTCEGLPGKAATVKKAYKNTKGIPGYIEAMYPDKEMLLSKPISLIGHMDVVEKDVPVQKEDGTFVMEDMARTIDLEVSFNFDPKQTEPIFHAFCNNIKNIDGGKHQDGVKNAIGSFFIKQINDAKKKNETTEYLHADVMAGIVVVLNMKTTVSTKFESQTKHRLGNDYFYKPVRQMAIAALNELFKLPENKRILTKILDYIKFNAKLRLEQSNKRSKISTAAPTFMDCKLITGHYPPNLIAECYSGEYEFEIYIVEGDSSGGQVRDSRYSNDVQGVLKLRGKPKKIWMYPVSYLDAHPNDMTAILLRDVLGCGWGKHFSLEKLRYKRIILAPDADIDGTHINTILLANIYHVAPALITEGYVYRIMFPLYKLMEKKKDKKKSDTKGINPELYLFNKEVLYHKYESIVASKLRLKFEESDVDYIPSKQMQAFLECNRIYYELIHEMSKYSVHPDIIEFLAIHPEDFPTRIQELDRELIYDESTGIVPEVIGCYKKEYYVFPLDELTKKKLNYLSQVIYGGNGGYAYYELYERRSNGASDHLGRKSIYQIMNIAQKYFPELAGRYKGSGELNKQEMQQLAMNPNNRVLIQFTVADMENLQETMDELFNSKRTDCRKKLIREAEITLDDIDN